MAITNPISRTAFYCCVIRADDAARERPVCGDGFAARFIDDAVRRELAPLLALKEPAASNVARHRLIDDLVRERLRDHPRTRVIIIGAGFDTRAFRLKGGAYVEFDEPALLAFKEEILPSASAPNPLTRIPVAFGDTRPDVFLGPIGGTDRALILLEGVSMYLPPEAIRDLATALARHLPNATLICDLMSTQFTRRASRDIRAQLSTMGVTFPDQPQHPSGLIESAGYRPVAHHSIVERARQAGTLRIPRFLLNTLLRWLRDGYQVWVFERPLSPASLT